MIFVSKYGAYKVVAIHEKVDRLSGRGLGGGFVAEFSPDVINKHMDMLFDLERQGRLKFNGLGRDATTNLPLDPAERCSSFDTNVIEDPDLRKRVEDALLAKPTLGIDFWQFEDAGPVAPWPSYDNLVVRGKRTIQHVAEKIGELTLDLGLDPETVIAYERANKNRPEVISALENLDLKSVEEDELVTA